jgi:hypothetical protein
MSGEWRGCCVLCSMTGVVAACLGSGVGVVCCAE